MNILNRTSTTIARPEATQDAPGQRPRPRRRAAPQKLSRRVYALGSAALAFRTFLTILFSSIRKARTMRSRTQPAQREPPYARETFFWRLEMREYSIGRSAGICGRKRVCGEVSLGAKAAA